MSSLCGHLGNAPHPSHNVIMKIHWVQFVNPPAPLPSARGKCSLRILLQGLHLLYII